MSDQREKPKMMVENISCIIPESKGMGGLFLGNAFGAQSSDILLEYGIRAVLTTSIETRKFCVTQPWRTILSLFHSTRELKLTINPTIRSCSILMIVLTSFISTDLLQMFLFTAMLGSPVVPLL